MMTAAILRAALDLKMVRAGFKAPIRPVSRFKPEMEVRGDREDYRKGAGLGVPWMRTDLAENRGHDRDDGPTDLWRPPTAAA